MISQALYALLSQDDTINELVDGRIYGASFEQGSAFPAICYAASDMRPLPCRRPGKTRTGTLDLDILANDLDELGLIAEALHEKLDSLDTIVAGYSLRTGEGEDEPDDEDTDLEKYYKRIQFRLTATKLD
ncbi:DUF3168 domain-containing protein [Fibrisoma montanum]|uniref:DUF3168 domain-containing protein n=1 Tax=Fibrisoma montanum TaxID=2305895 RepID=A0A418M3I9_9BACT|nr:DUF3168 domain-containing protein [Fibrisoma montanum]RIV20328.1 DUF3168 domain-containing protein [Fibrisoma montanum]